MNGRFAAIAIGSNSTRMLVADCLDGRVEPVHRARAGTRLFRGLSAGNLTQEVMETTALAVQGMVGDAYQRGAERVDCYATSATRDAQNGSAFIELVELWTGCPLAVLSGEEEARLAFLGATDGGFAGVLDIGGGSTELCIGDDQGIRHAASLQLGASRLLMEQPTLDLSYTMYTVGQSVFQATKACTAWPQRWYGLGGTLQCITALEMQLSPFDAEATDGYCLSTDAVIGWAKRLCGMHIEERKALPGMQTSRADQIAHGAAIAAGTLAQLGIAAITIRNRTNLDGYLKRIARPPHEQPM